ncbi:hypothetical protein [Candidatus Viadribacter manganicus]|uniref:Uncharacterized protein n=1 Tax=Candidatus Viadribacter manganicus TaxID=1759059 RepID=A0A1B1ALK0_9PROT|nr:hypothetical protein [Candidatus Viadribacter manganicus]ANP47415.1 hypothetical protein ATE48_16605 [Candidatus Viadribacter manganicus]
MLQKRKQARRRRVSFAQMAREIGPRLHTAFRRGRVALWRFKRSPEQQDRAAMVATFAFIGLFAIGSVDAIIMGRADFAPGSAYAAEYQPERMLTPAPARVVAPVDEAAVEEAVKSAASDIDYSFTTEVLLGGPPELEQATLPLVEEIATEGDKLEPVATDEAQADKPAF